MIEASTTCTVWHRRRAVEHVHCCPDDLRLGDRAADGTRPRCVAMTRQCTFMAPSSWGEASNNVSFAAAATQQYRWGSSHATSEWAICTTLPRDSALNAVSSRERAAFG